MKILCVGSAAYDVTVPVENYPVENTKNRVNERTECGGGPASNAAYLMGKWGLDVYFAGAIGDDDNGKLIKQEFKSVNVNTKYLKEMKNKKTPISFIIANTSNGTRTILAYREADLKLEELKLNFKPDFILIDGQEYEVSKNILSQYKDAVTIIDAGRPTEQVIELAKMTKYVVSSREFAESVTGVKVDYENRLTLRDLYIKMKETFNTNIIITLESKGCLYELDGNIKILPSIEVKAVDSTGAGDIFHGAFVYGLSKGFPLEKTLKIANYAGAMSVTRLGSRNSVFSRAEMKEIINEFE